jgi:hypothetical protein
MQTEAVDDDEGLGSLDLEVVIEDDDYEWPRDLSCFELYHSSVHRATFEIFRAFVWHLSASTVMSEYDMRLPLGKRPSPYPSITPRISNDVTRSSMGGFLSYAPSKCTCYHLHGDVEDRLVRLSIRKKAQDKPLLPAFREMMRRKEIAGYPIIARKRNPDLEIVLKVP